MKLPGKNETYDDLIKKSKRLRCLECGGIVNVAWGGAFGHPSYILRCGNSIEHSNFARPYEPTAYEIIEEKERKAMEQNTALTTPRATSLTKQRATDIINSLWGEAPPVEKTKAVMLCLDYGLNPLAKHIFLIPYNRKDRDSGRIIGQDWSLVMGIKAKRLIAYRRQGGFSYGEAHGVITPCLMTEDEEKQYFGAVSKEHVSSITIIVDSHGNKYPGYGRYALKDNPKGLDKGNSRANMANIRSESQALERYAPGAMPDGIDVVDAEFEELPNGGKVNTITGEIKETEQPAPDPEKELFDAPGISSGPAPSEAIDRDWLKESLKFLDWKRVILDYLAPTFPHIKADSVSMYLDKMTPDEQRKFAQEVERRLKVEHK